MAREGSTRPPHVIIVNYNETRLDALTWRLGFVSAELCWAQKLLSSFYHLYRLGVNRKEQNTEFLKYEDVKGSDVLCQLAGLDCRLSRPLHSFSFC